MRTCSATRWMRIDTLWERNMTGQPTGSSVANPAPKGIRGLLFGSRLGMSGLLLRVALAVVMFPHGAQKAVGWFGGQGWSATVEFFTSQMGMSAGAAAAVILLEFLGPVALLLGFLTRPVAAGFIVLMVGAIQKVHLANGFFMNWSGKQAGEGYEYHLLVIGIAAALFLGGGGSASIDRRLAGGS
jgi:putative oxidoreductase